MPNADKIPQRRTVDRPEVIDTLFTLYDSTVFFYQFTIKMISTKRYQNFKGDSIIII